MWGIQGIPGESGEFPGNAKLSIVPPDEGAFVIHFLGCSNHRSKKLDAEFGISTACLSIQWGAPRPLGNNCGGSSSVSSHPGSVHRADRRELLAISSKVVKSVWFHLHEGVGWETKGQQCGFIVAMDG